MSPAKARFPRVNEHDGSPGSLLSPRPGPNLILWHRSTRRLEIKTAVHQRFSRHRAQPCDTRHRLPAARCSDPGLQWRMRQRNACLLGAWGPAGKTRD